MFKDVLRIIVIFLGLMNATIVVRCCDALSESSVKCLVVRPPFLAQLPLSPGGMSKMPDSRGWLKNVTVPEETKNALAKNKDTADFLLILKCDVQQLPVVTQQLRASWDGSKMHYDNNGYLTKVTVPKDAKNASAKDKDIADEDARAVRMGQCLDRVMLLTNVAHQDMVQLAQEGNFFALWKLLAEGKPLSVETRHAIGNALNEFSCDKSNCAKISQLSGRPMLCEVCALKATVLSRKSCESGNV